MTQINETQLFCAQSGYYVPSIDKRKPKIKHKNELNKYLCVCIFAHFIYIFQAFEGHMCVHFCTN